MSLRPEHEELLQRSLARYQRRLPDDVELQRSLPSREALDLIAAEPTTIASVARACALYADRPVFAERAFDFQKGARRRLPRYHTISYADLWARVRDTASGLSHAGLVKPGDRVAISGFASVDWVVADLAALYLAAVSVPVQTHLPPADLAAILRETEPKVVVVSLGELDEIAAVLGRCPSVSRIVVMDLDPRDLRQAEAFAERAGALREEHGGRVVVLTLAEVTAFGRARAAVKPVNPMEARGDEGDPLMTLLYTSGSTGTPKGAMFPESLTRSQWHRPWSERVPPMAHVGVVYMPLNHAAGWFEINRAMVSGGLAHFVSASDMSTLFDDIRLARPTRILLVPRVSAMIYQHYQAELLKRGPDAEGVVLAEMRRSFLGDRLVFAMAGSAPTPPEILAFLERCFDIPVLDGYGSTEAGMISFDKVIAGEEVIAHKLVDVPELGYRTTDTPYPRGELCVKTRRTVPGYYRNPEATKALFDEEGFLLTGDIVEDRGGGEIAWIDRRKNILKLAQGEFVSTSRLEGVYFAGSPFIRQIYVHGSSMRAYLLAVIVPDEAAVRARLGAGAGEPAVKKLLRGELDRVAREERLQAWEVPRDFILEHAPFTHENGLLTASSKPSRPKLRARYGEALEALYADIEQRQIEKLRALESAGGAGVSEQVALAMAALLGVETVDLDHGFAELGGDSLGAARLAALLEERFRVPVPVGRVLDPTESARGLVAHIESRLAGEAPLSFERIHGAGATVVRAEDLRLDRLLSAEELDRARRAAPPRAGVRSVFLTGANGFLGRFLLLDLLTRLPAGGKVVVVVRAPSDEAARARIDAVYDTDAKLLARFQSLAAGGRLSARAGDLMKPRFGLSEEVYERLAREIDLVLHGGALVNHALSYPQLFEPNVLGTVEAIKLAATGRKKPIAYVSTVGVAGGLDRDPPVREDEDAVTLSRERPTEGGYAVGYATSKWAGEVLIGESAARLGLPVSIHRCSMIMPYRGAVGQVNAGDFLTRLFVGLVLSGVAPRSFYAEGGSHHFDGLPVDFVAEGIVDLALATKGGCAIHHLVNARWEDGVSLDSMARWIASGGYPLSWMDDYRAWLSVFRARLEALGPAERQRSPLAILHQWERPMGAERRLLGEHLAARGKEIPTITEGYVHEYLAGMVALGLIPPPGAKVASAA